MVHLKIIVQTSDLTADLIIIQQVFENDTHVASVMHDSDLKSSIGLKLTVWSNHNMSQWNIGFGLRMLLLLLK